MFEGADKETLRRYIEGQTALAEQRVREIVREELAKSRLTEPEQEQPIGWIVQYVPARGVTLATQYALMGPGRDFKTIDIEDAFVFPTLAQAGLYARQFPHVDPFNEFIGEYKPAEVAPIYAGYRTTASPAAVNDGENKTIAYDLDEPEAAAAQPQEEPERTWAVIYLSEGASNQYAAGETADGEIQCCVDPLEAKAFTKDEAIAVAIKFRVLTDMHHEASICQHPSIEANESSQKSMQEVIQLLRVEPTDPTQPFAWLGDKGDKGLEIRVDTRHTTVSDVAAAGILVWMTRRKGHLAKNEPTEEPQPWGKEATITQEGEPDDEPEPERDWVVAWPAKFRGAEADLYARLSPDNNDIPTTDIRAAHRFTKEEAEAYACRRRYFDDYHCPASVRYIKVRTVGTWWNCAVVPSQVPPEEITP